MRQALRVAGFALLSLFSFDLLIWILDSAGRWDFLVSFLKEHPRIAGLVHTPYVYLALLFFALLCLKIDKLLRQPRLLVWLSNNRNIPDTSTTTMATLFDSAAQTPGWDETRLDWHIFLEVRVTNEAEIPTTIAGVEAKARIKRPWGKSERIVIDHIEDFDMFVMDVGLNSKLESIRHGGERYRQIPNLLEDLDTVALEHGIGHRGWLRFRLLQVSQKDINRTGIDVWFMDALGGKHKMQHRKGNENTFDQNFYIFDDHDGLTNVG